MVFKFPEKIEVEERHISEGCQSSPFFCPIALAFYDLRKTATVDKKNISIYTDLTTKESINIDTKLQQWIANYDASDEPKKSEPITLILKENQKENRFYTIEN